MSNRIGASSPRTRFLGIVVGMAISELIDKPDNRMKFELDDAEASEAKWYQRLTHVEDELGNLRDLEQAVRGQNKDNEAKITHGHPVAGSIGRCSLYNTYFCPNIQYVGVLFQMN